MRDGDNSLTKKGWGGGAVWRAAPFVTDARLESGDGRREPMVRRGEREREREREKKEREREAEQEACLACSRYFKMKSLIKYTIQNPVYLLDSCYEI